MDRFPRPLDVYKLIEGEMLNTNRENRPLQLWLQMGVKSLERNRIKSEVAINSNHIFIIDPDWSFYSITIIYIYSQGFQNIIDFILGPKK